MRNYWKLFNLILVVIGTNIQIVSAQEEKNTKEEELVVSAVEAEMNIEIEDYTNGVSVPEELLRKRLAKLQNVIPFVYHPSTHRFVEHFITRNPSFTKRMMAKQPIFMPLFEKHLKKYGLPVELKYLSMIESGLDPRIISRVGAGGLWQFMPPTGREFGLFQDKYIDERFDPEKATIAACRYMKQLYRIFGDWELVLASYNTGPGNLRRAMRRSGGDSFWTVYDKLPKETRSYVPQFVAITYLMHYGNDHGIYPDHVEYPVPVDTLLINGGLDLEKFASYSGVTLEEIARLNPQLLRTEIPAYVKNYPLKIPSEKYTYVVDNRRSIWDSCFQLPKLSGDVLATIDSTRLDTVGNKVALTFEALRYEGDGKTAIVDFSDETAIKRSIPIASATTNRATHVVKRGETLSSIAKRHKVSMVNLRKWNGLGAKSSLRAGQKLVIHSSGNQIKEIGGGSKSLMAAVKQEAKQVNADQPTASLRVENKATVKSTTAVKEIIETKPAMATTTVRTTHVVKKGETLSTISKKHHVSITDLRQWNDLNAKSTLQIGQKLAVHKRQKTPAIDVKIDESSAPLDEKQDPNTAVIAAVQSSVETPATIKQDKVVSSVAQSVKAETALQYHIVQKGDTLWLISQKYGLTVDKLKKANQIKGNNLKLGQKLLIKG